MDNEEQESRIRSEPASRKKVERMNIRVGEKEIEVVKDAYLRKCEQDWKSVLRETREKMSEVPINPRLLEFYLEGDEGKILRRIKRIVREELKRQAQIYQKSQEVKQQPSTLAQSPKEKSDDAYEDDPERDECAQDTKKTQKRKNGVIERQMRYAQKKTPGQRMDAKFSAFVDSDESEDDNDDVPKPPKKKTLREVSYDAQTSHKAMCEKASTSLDLMNNLMKKFEKKLDDF